MRTAKRPVEIVLLGGKSLRGTVEGFDTFTIRLRCKHDEVLVFKSAIAVIGPVRDQKQGRPQNRG